MRMCKTELHWNCQNAGLDITISLFILLLAVVLVDQEKASKQNYVWMPKETGRVEFCVNTILLRQFFL